MTNENIAEVDNEFNLLQIDTSLKMMSGISSKQSLANIPAHLTNSMAQEDTFKQPIDVQYNQNAAQLSSDENVQNLIKRTKYPFVQEKGQRIYGPPPDWNEPQPERGCEVFIGHIPRDCFEDELVPVFERMGRIYMFRLMIEYDGSNRGYGFCVYTNKEDTKRAIQKLDNYEIRRGKNIGVMTSVDNCRLFVGGIPKNKTRDEILIEMQKITEYVKDVISYPSITDKTKNRGFAFVEYANHKAAAMARRKLQQQQPQLWGQAIHVDWAEPEREVNEDTMSKVKILYARNLMVDTKEETLRDKFVMAAGGDPTCVERVKKISDFAFIHFKTREHAERSLIALNNNEIDGSIIEVTWAKPAEKADSSKSSQLMKSPRLFPDLTALSPDVTALMTANNPALTTSTFFSPATVLPNGTIGAPNPLSTLSLQTAVQPRLCTTRNCRRNAAGSRSAGAQREKKHPIEKFQQTQVNPLASFEALDELCKNLGYGVPSFQTIQVDAIDQDTMAPVMAYFGQIQLVVQGLACSPGKISQGNLIIIQNTVKLRGAIAGNIALNPLDMPRNPAATGGW